MSDPKSRGQKVQTILDRIMAGTLSAQHHETFWLGGAAMSKDPDSLTLIDLLVADQITLGEACSGEPLKWIRVIDHVQTMDGVFEEPAALIRRWRELSEPAQQALTKRYELDRTDRRRDVTGARTEPSEYDLVRLEKGAQALALGEPTSPAEIQRQLGLLHSGAVALQSLDDLGSVAANLRAHRNMRILMTKIERLKARLERDGTHES